jgi:hypothetical protein
MKSVHVSYASFAITTYLTPLIAWRGDSFQAIRRLPRLRSRPKDEVLPRLPLDETV